ncbi:DUF503 domain-containing protein [Thermosulfurimonas dismutans]|nr:DUF503 domain-containing protein [Thermosulfurimonas dismutans]
MVVGVVRMEFFIPGNNSLKGKRQLVKSLLHRLEARFKKLSVAEVDEQDLWQKAVIGISTVGTDKALVDRRLNQVLSFVEDFDGLELVSAEIDFISY